MIERSRRIANEVAHGRFLRDEMPEVWAWSTPAGRRREERRAALLGEFGRFRPGEKVLEIGCGFGNFTRRLIAATGADIVGVDISPDLVEAARRSVPEARFEVADVHALPFAAASFDAICGSSILHHVELAPALAELGRVVRPGGRLVFAEPNMLNPQIFVTKNVPWLKRRLHETPHETAFVRWRLAGDLARAGFAAIRIFPFDFLHPKVPAPLMNLVEGTGKLAERIPLIREIAGSCLIYAEKPLGPS